jgi:calcium-dependent protein kinase
MGNKAPVSVKEQLKGVRHRSEERVGRAKVTGRYHLPPRNIRDDYIVENIVLGTGLNGSVFKGKSRATGAEVAIKPYTSVGINKDEQRSLRNEVEIFLSMDHPHIARLNNVYEEIDRLLLVMEVCSGGEILEYITKRGSLSEKKAADIVYQMLLAVNYLHDKKIVHRDLKLENFLFESKACEHVKLIDFGMSRFWTNNRKMKIACGTVGYVAPECLEESYDIKCDMWSMGVIVFVLLAGRMPFNGTEAQMIDQILAGNYSMDGPEWQRVSEEGKDFVKKLMTKDVEQRLSAGQALEHAWIAKRDATHQGSEIVDEAVVNSLKSYAQQSSFRRVCCSMMAYAMTVDERKVVRDAFLAIDTHRTGRVSIGEMKQVLGSSISDQEAQKVFSSLDFNHDEQVNYSDFLAAMMTSRIAQNERHIRAAFNRLDKDSSGFITLDNLREVLGQSHHGEDIEKLMAEADIKGDGHISYEEFMMYIQGDSVSDEEQDAMMRVIETHKVKEGVDSRGSSLTDLGSADSGSAPPAAAAPAAAAAPEAAAAPAPKPEVQSEKAPLKANDEPKPESQDAGNTTQGSACCALM